jgi:hypothetical protein
MPVSQAEVAVRNAVAATATRMPQARLSRTEYRERTLGELMAAAKRPTKLVNQGKQTGKGGPMHIAGRPPPL